MKHLTETIHVESDFAKSKVLAVGMQITSVPINSTIVAVNKTPN